MARLAVLLLALSLVHSAQLLGEVLDKSLPELLAP